LLVADVPLVPEVVLVVAAEPAAAEALAAPVVLAVAAALAEVVPLAAWVSACSKLANTVMP
jgi:hypothetical protein